MVDTQELCGAKSRRGYNQTTASGRAFWSLDPRPEDVRIEDIAAQLSRICRFGGALKPGVSFYSVAQHSVLVSYNVPEEYALEGLLHDAAEAYVGDVIKPIKSALVPEYDAVYVMLRDAMRERGGDDPLTQRAYQVFLAMAPNYKRIEKRVMAAIRTRFGLPQEESEFIKVADYRAVLTEHRDLQLDTGEVDWGLAKLPPYEEKIIPASPNDAYWLFMDRFNQLYKGE